MVEENRKPVDAFWGRLTRAAARADARVDTLAVEHPVGFSARVLQTFSRGPVFRLVEEQQRLVTTAALFALAASLLICVWSWPELQSAWSADASIAAPPVSGELWP